MERACSKPKSQSTKVILKMDAKADSANKYLPIPRPSTKDNIKTIILKAKVNLKPTITIIEECLLTILLMETGLKEQPNTNTLGNSKMAKRTEEVY